MTPLHLVAFLTAPALFPGLHPVAVWFGLGCVAVCAWVWWKADEMGGCETIFSMRAPLLLMPPGMFKDEDEVLRKIVDLLNANAALFFDSAKAVA